MFYFSTNTNIYSTVSNSVIIGEYEWEDVILAAKQTEINPSTVRLPSWLENVRDRAVIMVIDKELQDKYGVEDIISTLQTIAQSKDVNHVTLEGDYYFDEFICQECGEDFKLLVNDKRTAYEEYVLRQDAVVGDELCYQCYLRKGVEKV